MERVAVCGHDAVTEGAVGNSVAAAVGHAPPPTQNQPHPNPPPPPDRLTRRRWAMLIQRIYHADPLLCPKCGGTMKIIAFIEARQTAVIEKILRHCNLWQPPDPHPPPRSPPEPRAAPPQRAADGIELDPDFLEHLHREQQADQLQLPWES